MPLQVLTKPRPQFLSLLPGEFDAMVAEWGWPAFRAQQVRQWVYSRQVDLPREMSNLSKVQREMLEERMEFTPSRIASRQVSSDGTIKLLLAWEGGGQAETVMIPDRERDGGQRKAAGSRRAPRFTACVSSQVGCPVGCRFCASGINGVKGNLTAGQIIEQVYRLNQILGAKAAGTRMNGDANSEFSSAISHASFGSSITNIVFMGMGEPLANYANVMRAVRILNDPQCMAMGARRITLSTVGVPPKIRQLAEEDLPINLALSLHAPNEPLRRELIPWASHFALSEILDACRYYFEKTGREITLEYILLSGVNDRPAQARELAALCKTLRANVNLIRYNEVEGLPFKRPQAGDVVAFQEILRQRGVNAHVRRSRGRDIDAACGQLRRKAQAAAAENRA